jgi:carboxylesterase type B
MQGAWTAFARDGRPGDASGEWPKYDSERRMTRIFGGPSRLLGGPGETERAFLDQHMPAYGGGLSI